MNKYIYIQDLPKSGSFQKGQRPESLRIWNCSFCKNEEISVKVKNSTSEKRKENAPKQADGICHRNLDKF